MGLSCKSVLLEGGVIDSDFRENISVILTNRFEREIEVETIDRTAQMIFLKPKEVIFVQVKFVSLDKTERGDKRFGSTGK